MSESCASTQSMIRFCSLRVALAAAVRPRGAQRFPGPKREAEGSEKGPAAALAFEFYSVEHDAIVADSADGERCKT